MLPRDHCVTVSHTNLCGLEQLAFTVHMAEWPSRQLCRSWAGLTWMKWVSRQLTHRSWCWQGWCEQLSLIVFLFLQKFRPSVCSWRRHKRGQASPPTHELFKYLWYIGEYLFGQERSHGWVQSQRDRHIALPKVRDCCKVTWPGYVSKEGCWVSITLKTDYMHHLRRQKVTF